MVLSLNEKKRLLTKYGPWAVVTGASSGIGMAIATQLADAGFHLVLQGRELTRLEDIRQKLQQEYKTTIKIISSDLSDTAGTDLLIRETQQYETGLLAASAGFGTSGSFVDSSLHTEVSMLRVNCEAVLALIHHFTHRFTQQQRGGIILLSSLVAFQGVPYAANYAATKAYIQTLGEALAVELKPRGIDVLTSAPGPVESGFGKRANMKMNGAQDASQIAAPVLKALGKQSHVVPGRLSKLLTCSLRTVPRRVKIKIMGKIMGGMTKHQRE
jgi:uncharacterized protein